MSLFNRKKEEEIVMNAKELIEYNNNLNIQILNFYRENENKLHDVFDLKRKMKNDHLIPRSVFNKLDEDVAAMYRKYTEEAKEYYIKIKDENILKSTSANKPKALEVANFVREYYIKNFNENMLKGEFGNYYELVGEENADKYYDEGLLTAPEFIIRELKEDIYNVKRSILVVMPKTYEVYTDLQLIVKSISDKNIIPIDSSYGEYDYEERIDITSYSLTNVLEDNPEAFLVNEGYVKLHNLNSEVKNAFYEFKVKENGIQKVDLEKEKQKIEEAFEGKYDLFKNEFMQLSKTLQNTRSI